jgi:hypothetical protein
MDGWREVPDKGQGRAQRRATGRWREGFGQLPRQRVHRVGGSGVRPPGAPRAASGAPLGRPRRLPHTIVSVARILGDRLCGVLRGASSWMRRHPGARARAQQPRALVCTSLVVVCLMLVQRSFPARHRRGEALSVTEPGGKGPTGELHGI